MATYSSAKWIGNAGTLVRGGSTGNSRATICDKWARLGATKSKLMRGSRAMHSPSATSTSVDPRSGSPRSHAGTSGITTAADPIEDVGDPDSKPAFGPPTPSPVTIRSHACASAPRYHQSAPRCIESSDRGTTGHSVEVAATVTGGTIVDDCKLSRRFRSVAMTVDVANKNAANTGSVGKYSRHAIRSSCCVINR
ncbi:hypothetical protein BC828DRAFT_400268 [Blastocladiella britannica]|nr:hypothetical protein BC828DRAFT_400268 [Blastocladiella britannica]